MDEAGGGCPPEWVAGRSLLHVRGLISSSCKQSTPGLCLELEPGGKVNVGSLMARNREKHLGATCLPAPSFLLFLRICLPASPPHWGIQLEFDLKSLHYEFIIQAGPLASGL